VKLSGCGSENVLDLAADFVDLVAQAEGLEGGDGGLDDVGVIAGAEGLCEDVANTRCLDDSADAATSDDASTGRSGLEKDAAAAELADDLMRNRVVANCDLDEGFAGGIGSFANGLGDFVGLAEAEADLAGAVTGDDECAEGEAATALDDLGASVDENDFLCEIGLVAAGVAAVALIVSTFAGFSHN